MAAIASAQAQAKKDRRSVWTPYLFIAPAFIFFAIWVIYPIIQSFIVSFYHWNGLQAGEFIGLGNYVELVHTPQFWTSLENNVLWLVLFMLAPVFGLAAALFLNQEIRGMRLAKSLFFFPFVLSQVVIGLVFSWFYQPDGGLINAILGVFGIHAVAVLSNPALVNFGIIAAGLWPQVAYCMIIYLTGLNNLHPEQIEAARLEGARGWRLLWHIILPQLRPATFIAIVITVVGALRSFDLISIMTQGGPFNSSSVLAWFMYQQSITNYREGYGAAVAVVLFLIMSVFIAFFLWRIIKSEDR